VPIKTRFLLFDTKFVPQLFTSPSKPEAGQLFHNPLLFLDDTNLSACGGLVFLNT
jgi:hypothetical protein